MAKKTIPNNSFDRRAKRVERRRLRRKRNQRRNILALALAAGLIFFSGRFIISHLSNNSSAQSSLPESQITIVQGADDPAAKEEKGTGKDREIKYMTSKEAQSKRLLPRTEKKQADSYQSQLDTFLVTNQDVILYNRDSIKSTEVAALPKNTVVETYGHQDGWTKVTSVGREGYIRDEYLDVISDASQFVVVDGHLIVNASYGISTDYETVFHEDAAAALRVMTEAMERDGVKVEVATTYRSAADEAKELVLEGNPDHAPQPGHAVFQTGLGVKFYVEGTDPRMDNAFEKTAAFKWLKDHAHEYGFVLRYPQGSETITGYRADPTIFVYVGIEDASIISNEGLTLEVFYGVQ
ncbi:D-alanyl-D-alanine carboxypeptidase family protein [Kallipyga massiliensis]|uniref:D-alanyl-D-alanine carboxypeptidase family protein n=1 Tax=Kallipyga massiliensis TaxID=1472764 RepID=UPI0004B104C0|nr:M15 family metallopeptidase [Kallipyga massiliensis]